LKKADDLIKYTTVSKFSKINTLYLSKLWKGKYAPGVALSSLCYSNVTVTFWIDHYCRYYNLRLGDRI